ncbi:MAG TPA: inorganic phosphate transporter, partial [Parachlamydiaceae bacterium]|nr:inorganic phosphate transporter [Parachlamydiaceae bacterium]
VSTRVLSPSYAVLWAAFFNFVAMFIFAPHVANTISQIVKIESQDISYVYVILIGLISAIVWDLFTWRLGLPTSSSHALIGGLAGAGLAYGGWNALYWEKIIEIAVFIVLAPLIGLFLGFISMCSVYWICRDWYPVSVNRFFSKGQLVSAALYSIGHGANDAQKTMGIIMAVLIASGHFSSDVELSLGNMQTLWIILICHVAMAIGTAFGGWRIVKTMGMKIVKLKPVGGFCAETAGAATLFMATQFGIPVSTTHTIIGSIIGVGTASHPLSKIKWGVAANIAWSWILTIPSTAALAWIIFFCFASFQNR